MVLDSRDPALSGGEQPPTCSKTCGSKRCKQAIKKDACTGASSKVCVSPTEHTPADRAHAITWLSTGAGDHGWLNWHGNRVPKSHLAIAASLMPA